MLGREAAHGGKGVAITVLTVEDGGGDAVAQAEVYGAVVGHRQC